MTTALIIVDPQNDFCQGGALAVPNSLQIFPIINQLRTHQKIDHVFITLDWHPVDHVSFAETHQMTPFSSVYLENGISQTLWPTHCIMNTFGSNIHFDLDLKQNDILIEKGYHKHEDSYSGFGTKNNPTQLLFELKRFNVANVIVVGLAMDYCVGLTAIDAVLNGFNTFVVKEATKPVAADTKLIMMQNFEKTGVKLVQYKQILQEFK